jgi:hypothetical protein
MKALSYLCICNLLDAYSRCTKCRAHSHDRRFSCGTGGNAAQAAKSTFIQSTPLTLLELESSALTRTRKYLPRRDVSPLRRHVRQVRAPRNIPSAGSGRADL